jgi:hypothetical protein
VDNGPQGADGLLQKKIIAQDNEPLLLFFIETKSRRTTLAGRHATLHILWSSEGCKSYSYFTFALIALRNCASASSLQYLQLSWRNTEV